jgi:amidase
MSVFSLDASHGNPVTQETVDKLCSKFGVTIEEKEKEDYRRLLAVFHDASEQLMAMDGQQTTLFEYCSLHKRQIMYR